jgi:hypothetical protein
LVFTNLFSNLVVRKKNAFFERAISYKNSLARFTKTGSEQTKIGASTQNREAAFVHLFVCLSQGRLISIGSLGAKNAFF